MPGTQFLDAMRLAHATRLANGEALKAVPGITVREMLGAVLLDHADLTPDVLRRGTTVLIHGDTDVVDCLTEVVKRIYAKDVVVITPRDSGDTYDQAVNVGWPVVITSWDRTAVRPLDAVAIADRVIDVEEVGQASVIAALTEAVSGVEIHLSDDDALRFGAIALLRCCPLGSTGSDCERRIRAWLADADLMAAASTDAEAKKPADPVPVGAAAASVVRRLSEMTGFGDAGLWGINLAADLRDYKAGRLQWADVDRGVLVSGPPGGGKTTFAQALALECDVKLEVTTYSDWGAAGGLSGDSVSKGLSKLFDKWRKLRDATGPFILFVDELDSIGARGGNAHNESWFAPIVNAWLAFLDGAVSREGIVVVAATNYPDRVDPAMLRPGRLDRHIELPMPDIAALAGIVRAHLGSDAVISEGELAEAARAVRGRSPAQIQLLCRDARRMARWCKRRVCASDLTDVMLMQRMGTDAASERQTAVHEAAHAVALVLQGPDQLTGVDIDTQRTSMRRGLYSTRAIVDARMTMLLAARAAEEVLLGAPTSGASKDLMDATHIAMEAQGTWGMGSQGLMSLPSEIAWTDRGMRDAVRQMLDEAYARALDLVREHRATIERVADALVARRYLDGDEVRELVNGPVPTPAPVRRSAPTRRAPAQALGRA